MGLNLFRLLETRMLQEGASEMVQWLKVPEATSGNLSMMCGTNEVEGRMTPPTSCSLTFTGGSSDPIQLSRLLGQTGAQTGTPGDHRGENTAHH